MKTAKDLMTPNPKFIQSGESLYDTQDFFLEHDLHYVPVVTPMQEVLGLLSDFGLAKALIKNHVEARPQDKMVHFQEFFEEPVFVNESDALEDVIKELTRAPMHRVLVLNKQKKLVGIISPKDLLVFFTGERNRSKDLKKELTKTKEQADTLTKKVSSLEESLVLYRSIFSDSPYMMHSLDENGIVVMANKKIHATLGYKENELVGKKISDIYPKTVLHEAIDGLNEIKEKGFHNMTYSTMVKKNGEKIRIDIASSAIRDRQGKFLGTISISREIDADELLRALNGIVKTSP